ncbi:MAG: hypothetical protein K8T89_09345 [Planctomycetes bacterium]|nr:hypothetical protein [Planctomycetota bacterium]
MTIEQMRLAREANPFRPFTIHMADGRSWRIPHRDYLSMSPTGRTIIVYRADDSCSYLDLLLVTELTMDAPAEQTASESNN